MTTTPRKEPAMTAAAPRRAPAALDADHRPTAPLPTSPPDDAEQQPRPPVTWQRPTAHQSHGNASDVREPHHAPDRPHTSHGASQEGTR